MLCSILSITTAFHNPSISVTQHPRIHSILRHYWYQILVIFMLHAWHAQAAAAPKAAPTAKKAKMEEPSMQLGSCGSIEQTTLPCPAQEPYSPSGPYFYSDPIINPKPVPLIILIQPNLTPTETLPHTGPPSQPCQEPLQGRRGSQARPQRA